MKQDVLEFALRFVRWLSEAVGRRCSITIATGLETDRTSQVYRQLRNAITFCVMTLGCSVLAGCGGTKQADTKIACRSPNSDKQVAVYEWKFDAMREVLLKVVPSDESGVESSSLPAIVSKDLAKEYVDHLGNIAWLTETVRLEMEVRGELVRIEGSKPKRIRRPSI